MNVFIFTAGLCFGSFLNVCIFRIPLGKSIVTGRSACPHCGRRIAWWCLVPLLSYVILCGRCADCQTGIHWRYPVIELLGGITALALVAVLGLTPIAAIYGFLAALLIVIAGIDVLTLIIPNKLIALGFVLWLGSLPWLQLSILQSLLGGVTGAGMILAMALFGKAVFKKESMGLADIKLALVLGLFLGQEQVLLAIAAAVLLGTIVGVFGMLTGALSRDSKLPFGLFLAIGAVGSLVIFRLSGIAELWEYWIM